MLSQEQTALKMEDEAVTKAVVVFSENNEPKMKP